MKIVMVISLVGIVVFVGIAVFNNQNISYVAYGYVSSTSNKTDFDGLSLKIQTNVRSVYGGEIDPYATYIDAALKELNEGIDFLVDYLVHEDEITKGDQDKLCDLYAKYVASFDATSKAYDIYKEAYEIARIQVEENNEEADYAKSNVKTKAAYLVKEYTNCYKKGSEFFKFLVKIVNSYTLDGKTTFSFSAQGYMIKNGFVDYSLEFVTDNMNNKINNLAVVSNIRLNTNINNFFDFSSNSSAFDDSKIISNTDFKNFVNNLNSLNVYEWAGNFSAYVATLNDELKTKAVSALNFYDSNFKE